jgi:hypothetical protein
VAAIGRSRRKAEAEVTGRSARLSLPSNLFHLIIERGTYLQDCLHLHFGSSSEAGVFDVDLELDPLFGVVFRWLWGAARIIETPG